MAKRGPKPGHKIPLEIRARMNQDKIGKPKTPEHKEKIRQGNLGKICPTDSCIYCGKVAAVQMISRWHNGNCKKKP